MARATRIVLDLALVSLRKVRPAITNVWGNAKDAIAKTAVRPLVMNPLVTFIENTLYKGTGFVESKMESVRNKQFEAELKYLEREVENVKKKMKQSGDALAKTIRPAAGTAWQYAKVEMVPPMTQAFFRGPGGTAMEMTVGGVADGFIASLQAMVNAMEAAEKQKIKAKEEKLRAEQERAMEEAKKKAETAEAEAKKAKEKADTEAKKAAEAKKASEAKAKPKEEPKPKAEKKAEKPKAKAKPDKKPEPKKK